MDKIYEEVVDLPGYNYLIYDKFMVDNIWNNFWKLI